ncbi:TPA: hypothetical protein ACWL6U_002718 [Morganella morganii]
MSTSGTIDGDCFAIAKHTPHSIYFAAAQKIIELKQNGETLLGIQRYLNEHYPAPKKRVYKDKAGQALTTKSPKNPIPVSVTSKQPLDFSTFRSIVFTD